MLLCKKKITTEDTKLIQNANSLIVKFENVYEGFCFDEYAKKRIGEPIKEKRRCRFCHESMPNVTFKDVAHTIPEALGNKYIKTNDECDKCNHHFGATIEKDLLTMFDASRIFFGVRGKEGVPSKVKGDNYEIENDANNELHVRYYSHKDSTTHKDSQKLLFLRSMKIQPLNVYKALCKLAMGVLNEDVLKSLEKTRRWLMGEVVEKDLPKVALIYRSEILQHPKLFVLVRHNESRNDLPHVVVRFMVMNMEFVYILPFSDKDKYDYVNEDDFNRYWEFIDIYSTQRKDVTFMCLSEMIPISVVTLMSFFPVNES